MAEKEATVYVIDVGRSMGKTQYGRDKSDLDWAMTYVWDKITSIMALERKTTLQGVIGFKTDETNNELGSEEGFESICVYQELAALLLQDLKRLRHQLRPNKRDRGDAISAIVIAIQMIARTCKKLKYKRRIVLVTNGISPMDADDVEEITSKMNEDNIELTVLGVDFDDSEYGYKQEDKSSTKAENEATLKKLADGCNGIFGTLVEAIDELGMPRLKSTKPVPSYRDELSLGSTEYDTVMRIGVERYPRTMIRRPATASAFVQREQPTDGQPSAESSATAVNDNSNDIPMPDAPNPLEVVRSTRRYEVHDETSLSGKKSVTVDELAKGYEYGRTAVHISETDQSVTRMETSPSLEILGFIPAANHERFQTLSRTNIIIGQRANSKAAMALSSLIHALEELESYAIGRLVPKENKPPILLLLAPLIEPDLECLVDVELPFAEDVRAYKFAPLDRMLTASGSAPLTQHHRNLPSAALQSAMDAFVERMDISTFAKTDEGDDAEYLTPADAFSPVLHRIDQGVRFRAVHPEEPIPPPYAILTRYAKPPQELVDAARPVLEELARAADVKKVPPKSASRRRADREVVRPQSGLDVGALLGKKRRVDPENVIPSFKQMLDQPDDEGAIREAAKQLGVIVKRQVKDSMGDLNYERVLAEMRVFRDDMEEFEEPGLWNAWVTGFKKDLLEGSLGGDRGELWWKIRAEGLGLLGGRGGIEGEAELKSFLGPK